MAFDQQVIKVAQTTGQRLTEIRDAIAREKNRKVTYDEAVEYLLNFRDTVISARAEADR
jgi:hypothetical protein